MRTNSRFISIVGIAVAAALFAAGCSVAAATPASTVEGATATPSDAGPAVATPTAGAATLTIGLTNNQAMGAYLTGQNDMTLYILTTDKADTSSCSGSCATNWPPLTVAPGTKITGPLEATMGFATITRADGTTQVTYNHMPLYYFVGDHASGDTTGEGKNNVWFVAPVSGKVTTPATPAPTSKGGSSY